MVYNIKLAQVILDTRQMCLSLKVNLTLTFIFFFSIFAMAQEDDPSQQKDSSAFSLQINQDNTFGFFPMVFGSIGLKKLDLTFYSVFWTSPEFANEDGSGSLIETGLGLGFFAGNWYINPSVGFTSGTFTNGRNGNGVGRPTISESIVPGAIVFFKNEKLESEFFIANYQNLRKEIAPQTNYLFVWWLPGFKFNKYFSSGLHYEQFRDVSSNIALYTRYGLYGKTTFKQKYELRLSAGLNYSPEGGTKKQGDFYKLTVNIPF